jgi:CHAT domain-containing protein/histone H3/H4
MINCEEHAAETIMKDDNTAEIPAEVTSGNEQPIRVRKPPTVIEQDNLNLESYQTPYNSEGPDWLIKVLTNEMKEFAAIVEAEGFDSKVKTLRSLPLASHQRLFAALLSVSFQFQKVSRFREALELEKLRLELVRLRPETETSSFMENTQPRNVADVLQSIGEIYAQMGELSLALQTLIEAEIWYNKDKQLLSKNGIEGESKFDRVFFRTNIRADLCAHISYLYQELGEPDKAKEYDRKAWEYAGEKQTDEQRLEFLFGRANTYLDKKDYSMALEISNQALELALKLSRSTVISRDVSRACIALGDVYATLKLYRRALEFYERSYKLNQSSGHYDRMRNDCMKISAVYEATGKHDDAIDAYKKALRYCSVEYHPTKVSEQYLNLWEYQGSTYLIVRTDVAWDILYRLARIEKARKNPQAIEYLELAINVIERLRRKILTDDQRIGFQSSVIDVYEIMIELQLELWQRENDPRYLETLFCYIERAKSRVLIDKLADLPVLQPTTVNRCLLNDENRIAREIEKLESLLTEGTGNSVEIADKLISAQEEIYKIWIQIEQDDPYAGAEYVSLRRASPISVDEIREVVKQNDHKTAIIEYYLTSKNLIILIIFSDKSEIACRVMNISRDEIRKLALVNVNSPPSLDLRMPYWQLDLSPLLVEPIRGLIINYERVCFVPHDVLHSVPLHALHLGESDLRTCTEIAEIFYVPSASLLKYCRSKPPRNQGNNLVLGNPKRDDLADIPLTMTEARIVADTLGCPAFVKEQATKALLFKESEGAEYIHIACHGEFKDDVALSSALLLSDGDFTAREMIDLKLRSELVVLSACETGISENRSGDELIGFVRALLYAGTQSVILSLWNAYDESTSKLMISLYDKIIHQGLPKAKALSLAQRDLIKSGFSEAKWAPFILVGDWE